MMKLRPKGAESSQPRARALGCLRFYRFSLFPDFPKGNCSFICEFFHASKL